ncbi:MAG: nucleotidyltransferase domain-containing protein [Pseudomonadota bacterium]|nr:nucleotidyltransferase domain-containing protein [Pseudomonadota bacterium]MEA3240628.1 nucleotidyltransferase domain-containing protein [Pseudomonadota bacterium]
MAQIKMQKLEPIDIFAETVNVLRAEKGLKLAIIYGSAAAGNMRPDSDVDLALIYDRPLGAESKMTLAARLEQKLLRNVDLVDLSTLSGTILKQVLCKGRVLFQEEAGVLAGQIKKMIYNQADMMPYVSRTLLERQRRFVDG